MLKLTSNDAHLASKRTVQAEVKLVGRTARKKDIKKAMHKSFCKKEILKKCLYPVYKSYQENINRLIVLHTYTIQYIV